MNLPGEFTGPELVAGTVKGIRSFRVHDGELHSMAFGGFTGDAPFRRGENIATCGVGRTHTPGRKDCTCGFYAYLSPRSQFGFEGYGNAWDIAAVVEGYGRCTVGSKGFRAEKLRILAFIEPKRLRTLTRTTAIAIGLTAPVIAVIMLAIFVSTVFISFMGAATLGSTSVYFLFLRTPPAFPALRDQERRTPGWLITSGDRRKIKENYPAVPWISRAQAEEMFL